MKTINEVKFNTVITPFNTITYTFSPYVGAAEFYYQWIDLKSGDSGCNTLYGVSDQQGFEILKQWRKENINFYYIPLYPNS